LGKQRKNKLGKENWGIVKVDGKWGISSVVFSLEDENINPESKH